MANSKSQTQYIYISELPSMSQLSVDDLFVVSHLSNDAVEPKEYESCKMQYSVLREDIYDYISSTMSSDVDMMLLGLVESLSADVEGMLSSVDICLSACVALDNCRNSVKSALSSIDQRLKEVERRLSI